MKNMWTVKHLPAQLVVTGSLYSMKGRFYTIMTQICIIYIYLLIYCREMDERLERERREKEEAEAEAIRQAEEKYVLVLSLLYSTVLLFVHFINTSPVLCYIVWRFMVTQHFILLSSTSF